LGGTFSPDKDCTIRNLTVSNVHFAPAKDASKKPQTLPNEGLIRLRSQKPNPDYPKTTPQGGTGRAILIRK
jgi:hypothetical protein